MTESMQRADSSVYADNMPPKPATYQHIWQLMTTVNMIQHAIDLGLKFIKTKYDNRFQFIQMDSLQKLKYACNSEKIKDFLLCVFWETGVANSLGIGDFRWKFSIFAQNTEHLKRAKDELWRLFAKELDPDYLFEDFKRRKLVGEKDKDKVMQHIPGKQRMGFLLGRLVELKETDEVFEILLDHSKRYNYESILNKYAKIGDGQMLYTANATLSVCRKESTDATEENPVPDSELYSISLCIEDSRSNFDIDGDADGKESSANVCNEITMELIPDWDTTKEKATIREAIKEEIVIMGLKPDQMPTEEKAITKELLFEDEGNHQSLSTLSSNRLESSELDQTNSQLGEKSSCHSYFTLDDLARAAAIDTDKSLNNDDDQSVASIQMQSILKQTDELSVADMQKQLILKKADLIKEELDWPEIISISSSLSEDGYITDDELEQIWDKSQPRREAVDMLLKVVLGNLSTVQAFIKILNSESHLLYLAERINRTQLSADSVNKVPSRCNMQPVLQHSETNQMLGIKRKHLSFGTTSSKRKREKTDHDPQGSASDAVDKTVSSHGTDTVKQKLRSKGLGLQRRMFCN